MNEHTNAVLEAPLILQPPFSKRRSSNEHMKGNIGKGFTADQFDEYVGAVSFAA